MGGCMHRVSGRCAPLERRLDTREGQLSVIGLVSLRLVIPDTDLRLEPRRRVDEELAARWEGGPVGTEPREQRGMHAAHSTGKKRMRRMLGWIHRIPWDGDMDAEGHQHLHGNSPLLRLMEPIGGQHPVQTLLFGNRQRKSL